MFKKTLLCLSNFPIYLFFKFKNRSQYLLLVMIFEYKYIFYTSNSNYKQQIQLFYWLFSLQSFPIIQLTEKLYNLKKMEQSHLLDNKKGSKMTINNKNMVHTTSLLDDYTEILTKRAAVVTFSTRTQYFLQFLWPLHSFLGFFMLSSSQIGQKTNENFLLLRNSQVLYRTLQAFIYLLSFAILATFLIKTQKIKQSLSNSCYEFIVKNYSMLAKIIFYLTSFFQYLDFYQNVTALVISSLIFLSDSLFAGNYCAKKEQNYLTSISKAFILRFTIISNILINCILYIQKDLTAFPLQLLFFALITTFYLQTGGSKLYLHKMPKFLLIFTGSAITALGIQALFFLIKNSGSMTFEVLQWFVSFIAINFYFHTILTHQKTQLYCLDSYLQSNKIKDYELIFVDCQEQADFEVFQSLQIIGVLDEHWSKCCLNQLCWKNTKGLYDAILKQHFNPKSVTNQKDANLKFYLKCVYQTAILKNKTKQNLFDYCQFMVTEFSDFCTVGKYLVELQNLFSLNLFEKIKIVKLKLILEQKSIFFNKLLHGGRVELSQIFEAEQSLQFILDRIDIYCKQSSKIWRDLISEQVLLSQVQKSIEKNLQILPIIDQEWKKLILYFYVQTKWKELFLNYNLYLKNKKIRLQQINYDRKFIQNVDSYHLKTVPIPTQKIFNNKSSDSLFFDQNSTIFCAQLQQNELYFSTMNRSFSKVLGFNEEQAIGSSLNLIMPKSIQTQHRQVFEKWLITGQSLNENSYNLKITKVLPKNGLQFFALVLYKVYVDLADNKNLLNFVGLVHKLQAELDKIQINKTQHFKTTAGESWQDKRASAFKSQEFKEPQQPNIFMKDEQLQPRQINPSLARIIMASRIIVIFFIGFTLISGITFYNNIVSIQSKTEDYHLFLKIYRYPFGLANNYFSNFLNLSKNTSKTYSQINDMTSALSEVQRNPHTIKILTDETLNYKAKYNFTNVNSLNQGLQYDQIDLFYVIYSSLIQLSLNLNTSRTSTAFMRLNSFLKPSFDTFANSTKIKFHYTILNEFQNMKQSEYLQIIAIVSIFLVGLVYVSNLIYSYHNKMCDFMSIIAHFDDYHVHMSIQYWKKLQAKFNQYYTNQSQMMQGQDLKFELQSNNAYLSDVNEAFQQLNIAHNQNRHQLKLNQKRKYIQTAGTHRLRNIKILATIFFTLLAITIGLISIKINKITEMSGVQQKLKEGFYVLRHFPNTEIISYGVLSRYFSIKYPNESNYLPQNFIDTLSTFDLMVKYEYISNKDTTSTFYSKYKNYFFGNPCTYNQNVLDQADFTLKQCLAFSRNRFSNGISVYMRYLQAQIFSYLGTSQSSPPINIRRPQILNIQNGLSLVSYYIEDLIKTWFQQFNIQIQNFNQKRFKTIFIIEFIILFLHFIVFEWIIFKILRKDYQTIRIIYQNYVPEEILIKEKVIKQQFHVVGIIP